MDGAAADGEDGPYLRVVRERGAAGAHDVHIEEVHLGLIEANTRVARPPGDERAPGVPRAAKAERADGRIGVALARLDAMGEAAERPLIPARGYRELAGGEVTR